MPRKKKTADVGSVSDTLSYLGELSDVDKIVETSKSQAVRDAAKEEYKRLCMKARYDPELCLQMITGNKFIVTEFHRHLIGSITNSAKKKVNEWLIEKYGPGSDILCINELINTTNLIINTPPRHGKTSTVILCELWKMGVYSLFNETYNSVVLMYNSDVVQDLFERLKIRQIVNSKVFQDIFPKLNVTFETKSHIKFSNGSSIVGTGIIGGTYTSLGFSSIIIDDPYKNEEEARMQTTRDKIQSVFASSIEGRDDGDDFPDIYVIHTRWHMNDLSGWIKERNEHFEDDEDGYFYELNYECQCTDKDKDPLHREVGEWLAPEWKRRKRKDYYEATKKKKMYGSGYSWYAQYQGNPIPAGGSMIDPAKFKRIKEEPEGLVYKRFWDVAIGEGSKNDFTASWKCAKVKGKDRDTYYFKDLYVWKAKWPVTKKKICDIAEAEGIQVFIEANGPGQVAYEEIFEQLMGKARVIAFNQKEGKTERFERLCAQVEAGNVYIVDTGNPNMDAFNSQVACFSGSKKEHDDIVDATSGAYLINYSNFSSVISFSINPEQ